MYPSIRQLLREIKSGLTTLYGMRLHGVYLYGSYARDEAESESDVDVLVVLDDFERYGAEVDRTSVLVADLSLQYGVSVSTVFVRAQAWQRGDTPFLLSVREDAIPA